jgi:hypothetical protein
MKKKGGRERTNRERERDRQKNEELEQGPVS